MISLETIHEFLNFVAAVWPGVLALSIIIGTAFFILSGLLWLCGGRRLACSEWASTVVACGVAVVVALWDGK